MSFAVPVFCGLVFGLGILTAVAGWLGAGVEGRPMLDRVKHRLAQVEQLNLRVLFAVVAAAVMALLTGWIVGTVAAALGAATAPTLVGAKRKREMAVAQTEALATWAEQLRDTIVSAAGLREAVSATAEVAPASIAAAVRELEVRLRSESFAPAIRRFADRLADPTADKIAVALLIASERRGQRLADVLSEVARAARQQAEMQMRMEASRARTYTQALTVTTILLGMFGLLIVMSREYLSAYDTLAGQLVLLCVSVGWGAAFVGLVQLSKVRQPDRVLNPDVNDAQLGTGVSR